jgi:hypothetical protein
MLSITKVSAVLNEAFDELTRADGDEYVSVSATWTNPAGKLVSMHISLAEGSEDDVADDVDDERPVIRPLPMNPYPEPTR